MPRAKYIIAALLVASLACNTVTNILEADLSSGSSPSLGRPAPTALPFVPAESPTDETLRTLQNTIVPENDARELAARLMGIKGVPETLPPPERYYELGDRRSFWVSNTDTDSSFEVEAVLRYVGDELYFFIEDGVRYNETHLLRLAQTFENQIVPTTRAFFGDEWIPGVDNDPHIYILYVRGIGFGTAGYFSSADSVHPDAQLYSNGAEMFVFNADNSPLDDEYTYGVLAHEFQHMIHWYRDANETSWLNEGMSELAALLNGYFHGGFIRQYAINPDLQLNDWPNEPYTSAPHYGASFMFVTYFLERFGPEATQALVAHPVNGLDSVDLVLAELGVVDPLTGQPPVADDVVLDWAVANYLGDDAVMDGRYDYPTYPQVLDFMPGDTEYLTDCGDELQHRDVRQYGVDYIRIACRGQVTLQFEGANRVALLPADPYSGEYAFWSNKGDDSDMTLTRAFDFRAVNQPITLSYQTWYDIEEDWDYVYLLASTNEGEDWEFLQTPSGTSYNPVGNNYGFGYTGVSDGWITETVDLSGYAGQEVLLRFEYITDAALNGEGLLVDDITIPAIGYFEDFEQGEGGWEPAGFARVQNVLPQTFRLALISFGDQISVQNFTLEGDNRLEIPLDFSADVDQVTLVVLGSTRFTRTPAAYNFSFSR
ncbi:MAG: immune inhibitor A [Anaerolineales bacterium]|nr:immune inhibitor A [Anaerolineales bacterium]